MNQASAPRLNNFDALRLLAAFSVLISHQYALSGWSEPVLFGSTSLGHFGVLIFFSISGFLVSKSWRHDPHLGRFLAKRFLRIWPGLAMFTVLAACVVGPMVSTLSWRDYFSHAEFYEFFKTLKLFTIRQFLPGVFENNVWPGAVNGSLWTIPLEVRCYLTLALIGVVGLMRVPLAVGLGTGAFAIYFLLVAPNPANHQFHFGLYFFAGVCCELFKTHWEGRVVRSTAMICLPAGALLLLHARPLAQLLLVACLSIVVGSRSTPFLRRAGRFGDISYGVYVYAFGVQQTVMWLVGKDFPFLAGLLMTAVITTACAFFSWHLIESPALRLKSRLGADRSR